MGSQQGAGDDQIQLGGELRTQINVGFFLDALLADELLAFVGESFAQAR